jgi:flagellar biosynthesis component FlhA
LKEIYEQDFNQWLKITANLLQEKNFKEIDLDNLIIELESMGKNNKRELISRLIILIMHLLKWKYQPQKQSKSWLTTINEQRLQLELILEQNPSLKREIEQIITQRYEKARKMASQETGLDLQLFPSENPFNLTEILAEDFFP